MVRSDGGKNRGSVPSVVRPVHIACRMDELDDYASTDWLNRGGVRGACVHLWLGMVQAKETFLDWLAIYAMLFVIAFAGAWMLAQLDKLHEMDDFRDVEK